MTKRKPKADRKRSPDGSAHVYLVMPPVLYEWVCTSAHSGGFRNIQEKIIDVLRTAREAEQQPQGMVA